MNLVNPVAMILSAAMMLRYSLALVSEAEAVEEAVRRALNSGARTKDIGGTSSTKEVADVINRELEKLLESKSF